METLLARAAVDYHAIALSVGKQDVEELTRTLIAALPREWCGLYELMTPRRTDICIFRSGSFHLPFAQIWRSIEDCAKLWG